jgi:tetratricopeptide (TPR) repeat protein
VEMWLDGKRRLIQPITQEISDEFLPDYPEKARILYNEALTAHREGRIADAERLYEAMLKIALNAKEAYNNLAGIYAQRGEEQRANTYLDRALEIDPLYVFPRGSRALQALQRDDIEKAKAWLEPLHTVRQWHPVGFAYYQKVMARIAIAESEYELARRHLELASQFCEDPEIDELLKSVNMVAELGGFGDWWRGMADRYRSRRQKAGLPPDPTLADCFGLLTKGDMIGIRSTLDLQGVSALKKAEIKAFLMQCVSDADFLARVVGDLNDADRAALTDLLDHGGVIDWQEFSRAHGDDLEESPYLEYHAGEMKTVMGRLRARGLLFEGTANGKLILAIPRELRPMLQTILQGEKGQHKRGNP